MILIITLMILMDKFFLLLAYNELPKWTMNQNLSIGGNKNIPKDSMDTRADPQGQSPAMVHQWTLQGWIIQPYNFLTFCSLGVYIFIL